MRKKYEKMVFNLKHHSEKEFLKNSITVETTF